MVHLHPPWSGFVDGKIKLTVSWFRAGSGMYQDLIADIKLKRESRLIKTQPVTAPSPKIFTLQYQRIFINGQSASTYRIPEIEFHPVPFTQVPEPDTAYLTIGPVGVICIFFSEC